MKEYCKEVLRDEDGFVFTCDGEPGHDGPHHDVQYDINRDCFRYAEWPIPPPHPLSWIVPRGAP